MLNTLLYILLSPIGDLMESVISSRRSMALLCVFVTLKEMIVTK